MLKRSRPKKAVNLSLDEGLVEDAKELGVNLSQAAESGVREACKAAWLEQNAESIDAWEAWIEKNGLPLEKYRMF